MICSNCHHAYPATAFVSPRRVKQCTTCAVCRGAVANTRRRRNEGMTTERTYYQRDIFGLGCLVCTLSRCVHERGGGPVELCPIGRSD